MIYKFFCKRCNKNFDVEIAIAEYDKEKNNQKCIECGSKLTRVLEWTGIATGSGGGWFGKSDGSNAI
jgi:putative FmdB family regulatory protein